jgi:hypothetical protein
MISRNTPATSDDVKSILGNLDEVKSLPILALRFDPDQPIPDRLETHPSCGGKSRRRDRAVRAGCGHSRMGAALGAGAGSFNRASGFLPPYEEPMAATLWVSRQ